jgi:hypothetical protein
MTIGRIKILSLAITVLFVAREAQSSNPGSPDFQPVIPQAFGAIADGATHPVTAADLEANQGKWIGKYVAGDEWDYVGLQEALYACFSNGTARPNGSNTRLSKPLYLPPGNYLVNKAPTITQVRGGSITGAGRFVTTITSVFPGPAFQTNGCWYTQFIGITFAGTVPHPGGVFELDGNYDGTNKQGVQGNTFKDCYFEANGKVSAGFALVRVGGNTAQGSENLFLNCHFQSAVFAGVFISGFNALQNTFVGGNIQNCLNGIYVHAGSINVDSMGFQNGFQKQIDGDGFDVVLRNSADDHSSIRNCRSESARLIRVDNKHYVVLDNNNLVNNPPSGEWTAAKAYAIGAVVSGRTRGKGNGRLHIAITEGAAGGSEPEWPGAGFITTGTIAAGSDEIELDGSVLNGASAENFGVVVRGAGSEGKPLYSTIRKSDKGSWILADKAAASVSRALVRLGPVVADGAVKWMHYEFDEVVTGATIAATNNSFKWGRTRFGGGAIAHNSFARADNLELLARLKDGPTQAWIVNNRLTRNGGWNTGVEEKPPPPKPPAPVTP